MHTILIGDREIHLKYTARVMMTMEETAAEALFGSKRYMAVEEMLNGIDRLNVLIYIFKHGLDWKGSGAKPTEAEDLFDQYMEAGELDSGEKFKNFQMEIASAVAASRGIDLKKTLELALKAEAEKRASPGTGN